jgi:transcription termination/antitermination protein NusG
MRVITTEESTSRQTNLALSLEQSFFVPRWYVAYTLPRHEKVVAEQLRLKSVENYLPLFEKLSRWKDRMARVQLPLFPGYVFVRIALSERLRVLESAGVVRFVAFSGHPVPLPEGEIEELKTFLAYRKAEPFPYLATGNRVEIQAGPLAGLKGVVVRRKGKMRIVVSIDSIQRSIALELESSDVRLAA